MVVVDVDVDRPPPARGRTSRCPTVPPFSWRCQPLPASTPTWWYLRAVVQFGVGGERNAIEQRPPRGSDSRSASSGRAWSAIAASSGPTTGFASSAFSGRPRTSSRSPAECAACRVGGDHLGCQSRRKHLVARARLAVEVERPGLSSLSGTMPIWFSTARAWPLLRRVRGETAAEDAGHVGRRAETSIKPRGFSSFQSGPTSRNLPPGCRMPSRAGG